jgi:hypothetical protein
MARLLQPLAAANTEEREAEKKRREREKRQIEHVWLP